MATYQQAHLLAAPCLQILKMVKPFSESLFAKIPPSIDFPAASPLMISLGNRGVRVSVFGYINCVFLAVC